MMIYKEYLAGRNLSENTVDSYVYDVENFAAYLSVMSMALKSLKLKRLIF